MTIHIKPSSATAEHVERIREMRDDGVSTAIIATVLGMSVDTVRLLCARHEIGIPAQKGTPGLPNDEMPAMKIRLMTIAHLQDIHREHGYFKTWENYDIPPETAKPLRCYPSSYLSACGSPATMCAEAAGR